MMEYQNVPVAICFNKTDLVTEEELHAFADIYAACGYRTLYVSAKEEKGVDALLELLKGKQRRWQDHRELANLLL